MSSRGLPLEGLHVLELSSFVSASFAGTLLGDFGADVVKIELPGTGDLQRGLGTFTDADDERSFWWMAIARNKRSVALDLRDEAVRPVLRKLVEWADVVTENFRPGTLERWGIGWDWIHDINAAASLLRVSGYGQTGPDRERPSFERVAQAFSGLMYVTGEPERPPQRAGLPVCDYTSGLWGAFGLLLALCHQLRSGEREGQVIDHAIYSSVIPFMKDIPAVYDRLGDVAERVGNRSANVAPGEALQTSDGKWVFIVTTGDAVFRRTMVAIDRQELADDPKFATNNDRLANREVLDEALASWVAQHDYADVMDALGEHSVPVTPVQSIADLFANPQSQAREDFIELDDPIIGSYRTQGVFPKMSGTPGSVRRSAPRIGEHTEEVLAELGVPSDQIEAVLQQGRDQGGTS